MRTLAIISALFAWSLPLHAMSVSCAFNMECIEGETCNETVFSVSVPENTDQPDALILQTDAETLRGSGYQLDGLLHLVFTAESALHVISASADQAARYTVHMQGPMAITYQGTCEVLN